MNSGTRFTISLVLMIFLLTGCLQPAPNSRPWVLNATPSAVPVELPPQVQILVQPSREPFAPYFTPTPDSAKPLPTLRSNAEQYVVQPGDSLAIIALRYNLDISMLIAANTLINPNWLEVGQVIQVPAPQPSIPPSDFKIIPDSELVYGPVSSTLDIDAFVTRQNGYLSQYSELVDDESLTGTQIVHRVSYEYSINPRLLLAILEFRSGWVTRAHPDSSLVTFPMGMKDQYRQGLYKQLAWAANNLNRGASKWNADLLSYIVLSDGGLVSYSSTINTGTAAIQYMFGPVSTTTQWQIAVSPEGIYAVYQYFFGIPFDMGIEPLLPANLTQPVLQLPFEEGSTWSFTGGPHGGWGDGSSWAAVDFAPPGEAFGCFTSNSWVTAAADGVIVRAKNGAVVQDLDGDGLEQTGWTILYMHIESRDRVAAGTILKAGDRIGHASCEGGVSNGTHLHIARRYNGEWISADGNLPLVLSGWQITGSGIEYNGTLVKDGQVVTAWDGRIAQNQIQR